MNEINEEIETVFSSCGTKNGNPYGALLIAILGSEEEAIKYAGILNVFAFYPNDFLINFGEIEIWISNKLVFSYKREESEHFVSNEWNEFLTLVFDKTAVELDDLQVINWRKVFESL